MPANKGRSPATSIAYIGLTLLILLPLFLSIPGHVAGQDRLGERLFSPPGAEVTDQGDRFWVIQQRTVKANLPLLGSAAGQGKQAGRPLYLDLFPDLIVSAIPDQVNSVAPGKLLWQGSIAGDPQGSVFFARSNQAIAGTVWAHGRLVTIQTLSDGRIQLAETWPTEPLPEVPPIAVGAVEDDLEEPLTASNDDGSFIDVLVVYTPAARNQVGSVDAIEAKIDLAVAETNQAYQNSQINTQLRLVHQAEISYTETGNIFTDLDRLQRKGDGHLDAVHSWRDSYQADMVSLISLDETYCGIAFLMTELRAGFEAFAFSVVNVRCATGYYSFAHELGHNMGSAHERGPNSDNSLFDYSFGYQAPDEAFRTIMAYNCANGCRRVQHFSNPFVMVGGQPTGIDHNIDPVNSADNARSINEARLTVANWRDSSIPLPDPPTPPTNLNAVTLSFYEIALTWVNQANNADGILIERKRAGDAWAQIADIDSWRVSYIDDELASEQLYTYRVRAYNLGGASTYSNEASAETQAAPALLFVPVILVD